MSLERDAIAGMRAPVSGYQCRNSSGMWANDANPEREENAVRRHHRVIVERRGETTVALIESRDLHGPRADALQLFKPLGVLKVEIQRERLDVGRVWPRVSRKRSMVSRSVGSTPVEPERSIMRAGMWLFQKDIGNCPTKTWFIEPSTSACASHGEPKWPGADEGRKRVCMNWA